MSDCPICFESINFKGNNFVKTECGHEFHSSCLMMSALHELRSNSGGITGFKCPYCRQLMCQFEAPQPALQPELQPELQLAPEPEPRNGDIRRSPTATGPYRSGEIVERYWQWTGWGACMINKRQGMIYLSEVTIEVFNTICTRCQERGHDMDKCFVENQRSRLYDLANPSWCKRCGCTRNCGIRRKPGQNAYAENCRSTNNRAVKYDKLYNQHIYT